MLHEDVITNKLVDELERLRYAWKIEPQNPHTFIDGTRRPDFIVKEKGRQTVVAEVKIDRRYAPDLSVETQARNHIGQQLASYEYVTTAIAIRLPFRMRTLSNRELADELRRANDLHHVLFTQNAGENVQRFPNKGWITSGLTDIVTTLRIGAIPTSKVEKAASDLERGIDEAAKQLESSIEQRPEMARQVESILYQKSCEQTSRMAMLIVTNAFVFQSTLARTNELESVPALHQLRATNQSLNVTEILEAWSKIRDVNYVPIFAVAIKLVNAIASDDASVGNLCWILCNTAQKLIDSGLPFVHELAGIVFQRLIVDRDFIKTFYTRPESVALLSALVLPQKDTIDADRKAALAKLKIADFACGTGALLNGIYQLVLEQYEQVGGNAKEIHKDMVENNLVGCDIMPNASHLTAALITSNFPDIRIGYTRIHVLEYSTRLRTGQIALGALDLLENPEEKLPLDLINPTQVQGGADTQHTRQSEFKHKEMDIVIQNPPFIPAGADNNARGPEVPITIFGEQDPSVAADMRRALASIRNTLGNSRAFSSYFVDLADRMLKSNGQSVMGFVLPITTLVSPYWEQVRQMWTQNYHNMVVITIAGAKTGKCSFSADTNTAECLVVATKGKAENTGRGTFVCLHRRPKNHLEASQIAKSIQRLKNVRRFENSPIGGNTIKVGDNIVGHALNCSLNETWAATRVKDLSLLQSAYHLRNGKLWLPQQREPIVISMTQVGEIAEVQYDNKRITGGNGIFDIATATAAPPPFQYPGLWHVNANAQRTMNVEPDCHLIIREMQWDRARQVLEKNSRVHHMAKLRFNADSLAVLFTQQPTIGVNTILNVKFENTDYDYAWTLWGNSTLGLICYWMHGNKQHSGRSQIRLKALRSMPTLDLRTLDRNKLQNAKHIFERLMTQKMLPVNQMYEDPVRQELDRCLLNDVLGLTEEAHPQLYQGINILRNQLCKEPSIHGGKKSKVVL